MLILRQCSLHLFVLLVIILILLQLKLTLFSLTLLSLGLRLLISPVFKPTLALANPNGGTTQGGILCEGAERKNLVIRTSISTISSISPPPLKKKKLL